jgi:hypothetical protein
MEMKRYSLWKRFIVFLNGIAKLEQRPIPSTGNIVWFYLGKCRKHGYFEDYSHGFEGEEYLNCPECLKER